MAWFKTVSNAVYDALCAAFGVDPEAQSSLDRFIPAYVDGIATPQENRNVDVCYYALSLEQGTQMNYVTLKNDQDQIEIQKTIPVNVLLTFYGPNSDDDSERFWSVFQVDTGYGSPRSILRLQNIVPTRTPDRPLSVPEVEGSLWRRRCDVRLYLSYLDTEILPARTVEEVPDINITLAD